MTMSRSGHRERQCVCVTCPDFSADSPSDRLRNKWKTRRAGTGRRTKWRRKDKQKKPTKHTHPPAGMAWATSCWETSPRTAGEKNKKQNLAGALLFEILLSEVWCERMKKKDGGHLRKKINKWSYSHTLISGSARSKWTSPAQHVYCYGVSLSLCVSPPPPRPLSLVFLSRPLRCRSDPLERAASPFLIFFILFCLLFFFFFLL